MQETESIEVRELRARRLNYADERIREGLRVYLDEGAYWLWVDETRTLLVRLWGDETVEVAERDAPNHTWGPPTKLAKERVP